MAITLDEVRHVAGLARLELDEAELQTMQQELNALLQHFEDIQGVNVEGLEPKPHAVSLVNVLSDDEAVAGLTREQALRGAFRTKAGLFIVPTVIGDGH